MANGAQSDYTKSELELISREISESVITNGKNSHSFDLQNHYNTNVYLPQSIMNAHMH